MKRQLHRYDEPRIEGKGEEMNDLTEKWGVKGREREIVRWGLDNKREGGLEWTE